MPAHALTRLAQPRPNGYRRPTLDRVFLDVYPPGDTTRIACTLPGPLVLAEQYLIPVLFPAYRLVAPGRPVNGQGEPVSAEQISATIREHLSSLPPIERDDTAYTHIRCALIYPNTNPRRHGEYWESVTRQVIKHIPPMPRAAREQAGISLPEKDYRKNYRQRLREVQAIHAQQWLWVHVAEMEPGTRLLASDLWTDYALSLGATLHRGELMWPLSYPWALDAWGGSRDISPSRRAFLRMADIVLWRETPDQTTRYSAHNNVTAFIVTQEASMAAALSVADMRLAATALRASADRLDASADAVEAAVRGK